MRVLVLVIGLLLLSACKDNSSKKPEGTHASKAATSCPDAPRWVGMPRCKEGGLAYGAAAVIAVSTENLARLSAAQRARNEVLRQARRPSPPAPVEVMEIFRCGSDTHALARTELEPAVMATLPDCDEGRVASRGPLPLGCLPWTAGDAWLAERAAMGIGTSKGNDEAARTEAEQNALRNLKALLMGTGLAQALEQKPSLEVTTCGSSTYVRAKVALGAP